MGKPGSCFDRVSAGKAQHTCAPSKAAPTPRARLRSLAAAGFEEVGNVAPARRRAPLTAASPWSILLQL